MTPPNNEKGYYDTPISEEQANFQGNILSMGFKLIQFLIGNPIYVEEGQNYLEYTILLFIENFIRFTLEDLQVDLNGMSTNALCYKWLSSQWDQNNDYSVFLEICFEKLFSFILN